MNWEKTSSEERDEESKSKITRHLISCVFILFIVAFVSATAKGCFVADKEHTEKMKRLELIEKGCIEK